MFRFYRINSRNETGAAEEIVRTDGGWWFSEESSKGRFVYEVLERKEISPGHFLDFLAPLPDDFVQLPCWEEDPLVWRVQQKEAQGLLVSLDGLQSLQWPVGLEAGLAEPAPGPAGLGSGLGSGPAFEHPQAYLLPCWVQEEVGHLSNIIQQEIQNMISLHKPLPPRPQEKKQQPTQNIQKQKTYQNRREPSQPPSQHAQVPSVKYPVVISSSSQAKDLQMGAICSPSYLPEGQSPREILYHPSRQRKHHSQAHCKSQMKCLILQE